MRIQLSDHFNYKKLLLFVLPSIAMMVFTKIYSIVDGLFVSNFVGKEEFTAINLMTPMFIILGAVGFMFGTGGSALVSKTLGEGESEKAKRIFSMLVCVIVITGVLFTALGEIFLPQIAVLLGANEEIYEYCIIYGRIMLGSLTFYMLLYIFQSFFAVAEKARLGLIVTVISGIMNIVLDALFIIVFKWGIIGAAVATAISQVFGGLFPFIYFLAKNNSLLRLKKPLWNFKLLLKACTNGSSEFLSNISASVIILLYNFQLMKLAGNDGVAALGAIMYIATISSSVFSGYTVGSSPIISYNLGAQNKSEMNNLLRKSLVILFIFDILMTGFSETFAIPLTKLFVGYDETLYNMTLHGLRIYAISFLLLGFNIFASAFFTAFNNGLVSVAISFSRTVFVISTIMVLPIFLHLDGVWWAVTVAEVLAVITSIAFVVGFRKKYGYSLFNRKTQD